MKKYHDPYLIQCVCMFLIVVMTVMMCGASTCVAEATTSSNRATAARLIELGYLAEDYSEESFSIAVRDFRKANNLPDGDTLDEHAQSVLMSSNARTQQEYISSKAQAMREQTPLSMGAYGDPVLKLQKALASFGYYTDTCNGAFNETTEIAVCRFQLACGLNVTGIADRTVYLRLYESEPGTYDDFLAGIACAPGDSGDNVRTVQTWLKKLGFKGFAATGSYGTLTTHAVEVFQKTHGLEVTGIADIDTVRLIAEDVLTIRRTAVMAAGDAAPEEVASLLENAGYEPGNGSDMQTELSIMKYQKQHGLAMTGIADADTVAALRNSVLPVSDDEIAIAPDPDQVANNAYEMIGNHCEYASSYGFPEYVYLKAGLELPSEVSARTEALSNATEAIPGDVIKVSGADGSLWGIAIGNGGMVCMRDGLAVLCYPDAGCEVCRLIM